MLGGIALLGVVTSGLASWLLDRIREVDEESEAVTRAHLARPTAQIDALTQQIARIAPGGEVALAAPHPTLDPGLALRLLARSRARDQVNELGSGRTIEGSGA